MFAHVGVAGPTHMGKFRTIHPVFLILILILNNVCIQELGTARTWNDAVIYLALAIVHTVLHALFEDSRLWRFK